MLQFISLFSSGMLLFVYVIYFKQVSSGDSKPNPVSWLTWAIVSSINSITYLSVVEGNYWKAGIAFVANISMISICAYAFYQRKFSKLNLFDFIILCSTVFIGIIWKITQDDRLANILVQFIFIISFIPTIYGLFINTLKEKPFPWWLAVFAYFIQIITLIINFNGDWLELLFPFINGIVGNGSVAVLATIKK